MPNYKNGKIYKIYSNDSDLVYYGSTTLELHRRFYKHSAKKIIPNCKIELVENYPCNSKYELELQECKYIENNKCINIQLPACCLVPNKKYYQEHKVQMRKYIKTW